MADEHDPNKGVNADQPEEEKPVEATEEGDAAEEAVAEPSFDERLKEAIDVELADAGSLRKKLTITVPREMIDEQFDEQYDELRREAQVPGFRKGRAPRRLLEKRFGSEVDETLTQRLVTSAYVAATEKKELKALGDPLVWATEKEADSPTLMDVAKAIELIEIPSEGSFTFACEVEIQPEFDLPAIEGIELTRPVVKVKDEDVDAQIERLRGMAGSYENIEEGPIEADDAVMATLKMTCGDAVLKEEAEVRLAARPQVVDGVTLEKLGEVLVGAKVGDNLKISGQIPEEYEKEEFRGKQADFAITVKQIQRLRLPEVDEAFLNQWGFEAEKDLRDWVRSELESRLDEEIEQHLGAQVCDYLLKNTAFELPERMSEQQVSRAVARRMVEMYQQGVPPAEVEKHLDELKTGARQQALDDLKLAFVMEKLAEQVEVEVSEGEINAQIASIAQRQGQRFDRVRDELSKKGAIADLFVRLRDNKIIRQLVANAKITEQAPDAKGAEGAPAEEAAPESGKDQAEQSAGDAKGPDEPGKPAKPRRKPPQKKE